MKNLDYALLLEIYGNILTEKQRNVMELYYWEDFSLGEISQSEGVTRQAVRDSVKRSEQLLDEYEEKLCIAEKIKKCRENFNRISVLAENLKKDENDVYIDHIRELAKNGSEIF